MNPAPRVVLLHGLWMPALSMSLLGRRLRAAGFATLAPAWWPRRDGVTASAARLHAELDDAPALFVGHSLGGRLALALTALRDARPSRVVALGTPFLGSLAGQRLASVAAGRWLLERAASDVTTAPPAGLPEGCELGVVAGTRPLGLGRLVTRVTGPSDGTVRVDETRHPDASDWLALPETHLSLPLSMQVAQACAGFLREGKFPVKLHDL